MATINRDGGELAFYRRFISRLEPLDATREAELAREWRAGNQAAGHRLVEANLKLVLSIAHEYRRWGVPLEDLVQQGSIGLMKAAERFDPEQPNGLAAYAAYWIRAEIREYVVKTYRIVRLGTTRTERRAVRAFRSTAIDSAEELAERSGMPLARCQLLWPLLQRGDRSLEASVDGRTPGRELLADRAADPETRLLREEKRALEHARVEVALEELSDRERQIVHARMMDDETSTLEQLGKRMGVSRERVRQLESRAKDKVKQALCAA